MRDTLLSVSPGKANGEGSAGGSGRGSTYSAPRQGVVFVRVSRILMTVLTLGFLVLLGRVAQIQLRPSAALQEQMDPRVARKANLPVRGDILDRRGRLLSATRFGQRIVIDPTLLKEDPSADIKRIADAAGMSPEEVGQRIIGAMIENERRGFEMGRKPGATKVELQRLLPRFIPVGMGASGFESPADGAPAEAGEASPDGKGEEGAEAPVKRRPIRYLPIGGVLTDTQARAVADLKIKAVMLENRPVREYPGGSDVASLVGKVGFDDQGLMGAEKLLERELTGKPGEVRYIRDKVGRPLWMEPGSVQPAVPGADIKLSIDLELQRIAYEELQRGVDDADAAGGRLVLLDSRSGEILAMVDLLRSPPDAVPVPWVPLPKEVPGAKNKNTPRAEIPSVDMRQRFIVLRDDPGRKIHPALGRNRCIEDIYEPGSTFKSFVWSTITELGLAKPDEVFETKGPWQSQTRTVRDVQTRPTMTWSQVLINSSNIGMIKGATRMKFKQLHDAVDRFGFGKRTGIGLPGESPGIVTPLTRWTIYTQESVASGYEVSVTPVQMVRAFSAFARPGEQAGTLPRITMLARKSGEGDGVTYRVLPSHIASLTRETMRGVTLAMENKITDQTPEGGWRYEIFGKSGTAKVPVGGPPAGFRKPRGMGGYFEQYNSSFIAGGPVEDPRLVILVVIDDPGPERIRTRRHYGSSVAGPVVRRVMERSLTYLGVPASPPEPVLVKVEGR